MKWISTTCLLMALGLGGTANQAMAQEGTTGQSFDALSARLEQQDQQIRQLQAQVSGMQQQGVNATPASYAPGAASPAPAQAAPACAEVGSDMSAKVRFWNGAGLMFESPNKDFTFHLGGWAQYDNVWWDNSPAASTAYAGSRTAGAAGSGTSQGVGAGGIGTLEDGDYWRRLRIVMEGTFWETFEYRWNWALENDQFSTIGLDEMWVGVNKLPVIGTIRLGHVKTPMGLEGDMTGSSRAMTFMERSAYSESIELNENFGAGIWFSNTYANERGTWSFFAFRPDTNNDGASGDFFGTGQWGLQGRITGLPLYEDEGRHLLHLGLSAGWRNGNNAGNNAANGAGGLDTVDLRARPELRDDDPAGSPGTTLNQTTTTATGPAPLPDANSNRMIDTGKLAVISEYLLGTEFMYIRGPLSLQGEYGWNMVYGLPTVVTTGSTVTPQYYVFNGGYLQAAYTLTGENRAYDRQTGTLSRWYFGSQGPYENAFMVRDEGGGICAGHGAWEIAARFSYVDLNAGPKGLAGGADYVNGGIMNGYSLALNWYLNTNLTVMTDWVVNNRYDLPNGTGVPTGTAGKSLAGTTNGLGMEVQLSF
jgi:phosphate-selective porin OprO and OprP